MQFDILREIGSLSICTYAETEQDESKIEVHNGAQQLQMNSRGAGKIAWKGLAQALHAHSHTHGVILE